MSDTITQKPQNVGTAVSPTAGCCEGELSATGSHPAWEVVPRYQARKVEDHAWELRVTLPGVRREDVSVSLEDDELEIVAERKSRTPENWRRVGVARRIPDRYRLELGLGVVVDPEKIAARLEDGVLTVQLSAPEEARPKRISVD